MRRYGQTWFAVAVLLACAGAAWSQASTQPAGDQKAGDFKSLADLQKFYADKFEDMRRTIEGQRLAALERLLKSAPANEHQQVLRATIESAMSIERYDLVVPLCYDFIQTSPPPTEAWAVMQMRGAALIATNQIDTALKEWEQSTAKLEMEAWQQVLNCGLMIADGLLEAGRVADVTPLYKTIRERFSFVQNLAQVMGPREDALRWIGKVVPALEGQDLNGQNIDFAQYKGKVVLIDFWATWCQPCVVALPELIETYKTYHDAGFEIVGISLDQEKEVLTKFVKARQIPWRILFDGKVWYGANPRRFEVASVPATFLVDRSGRIVSVGMPSQGYGTVVKRLLGQPVQKK